MIDDKALHTDNVFMPDYILGVDIGTGSTKCIAVDGQGKVAGSVQHHYLAVRPQKGYSEQDPELVWQAFVSCITEVSKTLGGKSIAISFSSAMHSIIPVDENGKALSNMITWADVRSADIADSIRQSVHAENIYRTTGTPIHPMSPLCKLMWLKQHQPDVFGQAAKFISIKEYIWRKLFNVFEVDYSIASATGLFDIIELCWSQQVCNFAGVEISKLSQPQNTGYTRNNMQPSVAMLLGIPQTTPVIIGASDGCCANLGSFVNAPGTAALTIGTSGAVRITSPAPVYDFAAMTFNYLLDEKTFVCGGAVNNGGNAVDWLLKSFFNHTDQEADYKQMFETIAAVPAGSNGLLFLPYLFGERAPVWDAKATGSFFNIRPEHTQNHFLRAALEGICFTLNDVLNTLEKSSSPIKELHISGGFTTSAVWMQLLADVTGKKLVIAQPEDASAMGAAYLAFKSINPAFEISKPQVADDSRITANRQNYELYVQRFAVYKKVYEQTKALSQYF